MLDFLLFVPRPIFAREIWAALPAEGAFFAPKATFLSSKGAQMYAPDGWSGPQMSTNNLIWGFSANPTISIFRKWLIFFFLRGAFENGLKNKACHEISIFENCVSTEVLKCLLVRCLLRFYAIPWTISALFRWGRFNSARCQTAMSESNSRAIKQLEKIWLPAIISGAPRQACQFRSGRGRPGEQFQLQGGPGPMGPWALLAPKALWALWIHGPFAPPPPSSFCQVTKCVFVKPIFVFHLLKSLNKRSKTAQKKH